MPAALALAAAAAARAFHFNEHDRHLAAWMHAGRTGDGAAFENLVRASIPLIKSVARGQGVPADFVDDVVQETLLTVHRMRGTYDPDRPFTPWLRAIAQRRAIDILRRQVRTARREVHEPIAFENHTDPAGNPEDAAVQVDRKGFIGVAVASLPARQREAVEQLALNEKSFVEAAEQTGQSPRALSVSLHRALSTLRARFGNQNF